MKRRLAADAAAETPTTYVVTGGVYVDTLHEVAEFPDEDSTCRALSVRRRRGGNAATTACVLAQCVAGADAVMWMGVLPSDGDNDSVRFALDDMHSFGVDTSLRERVAGEDLGLPSAMILVSRAKATRTIVSSRRGMRELSPCHFEAHLPNACRNMWVHLEAREVETVAEMASTFAERRRNHRHNRAWQLSVEIEKPAITPEQVGRLIAHADVAFFSREWIEQHSAAVVGGPVSTNDADHVAVRTLRGLLERHPHLLSDPSEKVWFCAWGATGAYAFEPHTLAVHFQPAADVAHVIDTTGAGDTFIGACIAALSQSLPVPSVLQRGCSVAGKKVAQDGFAGLRAAFEDRKDL